MGYNEVAKILILTISVVTATTAISLMSQSAAALAAAICAGITCAAAGGGDAVAFNPGAIAGLKPQPGAITEDGSAASSGSIFCNGKPAAGNVITGPITCTP